MRMLIHYLIYYFKSSNLHGIHSPFVYELVKNVIYAKSQKPFDYKSFENLRKRVYRDTRPLTGIDYGAGSSNTSNSSLGRFAQSSTKSVKYCNLLYRLALWKKPHHALEFGTALGFSAAYQAAGFKEDTKFTTMEGNPWFAKEAKGNLNRLNLNKIEVVEGPFKEVLPSVLNKFPKLDWVFFDGNHQLEATLEYFETCLAKASHHALFIFDDINWSTDMRKAWTSIKKHPSVGLTIDLFFMGLVFLEPRAEKEHFVVRF